HDGPAQLLVPDHGLGWKFRYREPYRLAGIVARLVLTEIQPFVEWFLLTAGFLLIGGHGIIPIAGRHQNYRQENHHRSQSSYSFHIHVSSDSFLLWCDGYGLQYEIDPYLIIPGFTFLQFPFIVRSITTNGINKIGI